MKKLEGRDPIYIRQVLPAAEWERNHQSAQGIRYWSWPGRGACCQMGW